MSSFSDKDAAYFRRALGGFGKPGAGEGLKANGEIPAPIPAPKPAFDLDAQLRRDEEEDTAMERGLASFPLLAPPPPLPPLDIPDELNGLARDIRLMPGTLVARLQQELLDCLPRWMPGRERLVSRLWQLLFIWSIRKWEEQNPVGQNRGQNVGFTPVGLTPVRFTPSMERLSAAIMPQSRGESRGQTPEEAQ